VSGSLELQTIFYVFHDIRGRQWLHGVFELGRPPRGEFIIPTPRTDRDAWDSRWGGWFNNVESNPRQCREFTTVPSYEGWTELMSLLESHPALNGVQVNPLLGWWLGDDWFHNGVSALHTPSRVCV